MENKENKNAERTTPPPVSETTLKTPKAFIGYIIVAVIIIVAALGLFFGKGSRTDMAVNNGEPIATTTVPGSNSATTTASSTNPGGNDMNGSGQNEPSKPAEFTGYQSPISVALYREHIVGGEQMYQRVQIYAWAVLEDSRCPIDVQCIQAGRVRVGVRFVNPETKKDIVASQVMEVDQKVKVNGLEIVLLEVKPVPKSTVKINDKDYRFIFDVRRAK